MTSNERKIIKSLWSAKGQARVQHLAGACGIGSDYARLLCRSLARAGYIEFASSNECRLLKKGSIQLEDASLEEVSEKPIVLAANVTLLTDVEEDTSTSAGEENHEIHPVNDEALEKALADRSLSQKSDESKSQNGGEGRADADTATVGETDTPEMQADEQKEETPAETPATAVKDQTGSGDAPATPASSLNELPDASEKDKEKLVQAGYKTAEDLAQAPLAKLIQGLGVSLGKAASWINQARRQTGVIHEGGRKNKE